MAEMHDAKKLLRREIAIRLRALTEPSVAQQSTEICSKLMSCAVFRRSKAISIFIPMEKEVNTLPIINHLSSSSSQRCFVPKLVSNEMKMLQVLLGEDVTHYPRNSWQIPEPPISDGRPEAVGCPLNPPEHGEPLHLIVCPGVAFDRQCRRLGHGKGYYDRFISGSRISAERMGLPAPLTIGVALSPQMSDDPIPTTAHDITLDAVIWFNPITSSVEVFFRDSSPISGSDI